MPDLYESNLLDAAFRGRRFPVGELSAESDHDAAEHVAYRRRGADIEPLGRKADRGTLSIPLYNTPELVARYGTLYPDLFAELLGLFDENPIGELTHPTLGTFRAKVGPWRQRAEGRQGRNGITLELAWVEHNAEAGMIGSEGALASDPSSQATTSAEAADAAMLKADPELSLGWALCTPPLSAFLLALEAAELRLAVIEARLAALATLVSTNLGLLTTAGAYEAVQELEALRVALAALRASLVPTANARPVVLAVPMALHEIAAMVYGDASRTDLLTAANTFDDPLVVPAGTTVLVPPLV